nr:MAG TPA: hypothetical protein [Caudoviricetes sp.]
MFKTSFEGKNAEIFLLSQIFHFIPSASQPLLGIKKYQYFLYIVLF